MGGVSEESGDPDQFPCQDFAGIIWEMNKSTWMNVIVQEIVRDRRVAFSRHITNSTPGGQNLFC